MGPSPKSRAFSAEIPEKAFAQNSIQLRRKSIQLRLSQFSLVWLSLANLVGVLLAILLIWPQGNAYLGPFTYGRWMPLHMDWHLYGWCALPLLGILCARFLDQVKTGAETTTWILLLWTLGLAVGGWQWLAGGQSGKPFLNWTGYAGIVFCTSLLAIWGWLALGWIQRLRTQSDSRLELLGKGTVLAGLLTLPFILRLTSNPVIYPPINPNSGGATGHSLLASTLGIVFLMGIIPPIGLKLPTRGPTAKTKTWAFWSIFILSLILYAVIEHGNVANTSLSQILALGSLMIWPILVIWLWSSFKWSAESKIWRWAFFTWWALLTINGWTTFLPGTLDTLKFTNSLVAHTHLAMAGMITTLNIVILIEIGSSNPVRKILSSKSLFWIWNAGCALYVASMLWQGIREGLTPGVLFTSNRLTDSLYIIRLIAGAGMTLSGVIWTWKLCSEGFKNFQPREQ
jgi:cytochrome c oxidase cbb3-type subunit 1